MIFIFQRPLSPNDDELYIKHFHDKILQLNSYPKKSILPNNFSKKMLVLSIHTYKK